MDFNKLRTFIRVVEAGSISQAASICFRTQQAVSLQIRLLERDLNVQLFHRAGPKLYLTREGEMLYRRSKEHLLQLEASLREIKSEKKAARGTITLGLWSEQSVCPFPGVVTEFRHSFPGADVKIVMGTDGNVEDLLLENKLDLAIVACLQNPQLFSRYTVLAQEFIPVAATKYLSRSKPINDIADTLGHDILDYSNEYSAYRFWVAKNQRELLPLARKKHFVITVDNDLILKKLMLQGNGIAFLSRKVVDAELASGEVVQLLPERAQPATLNVDIAHRKERALSYLQDQFLKFVTAKGPWAA